MELKDLITEFSNTQPKADIIVGYGSGVKKQANDKGFEKQIDLIMGVKNITEWYQKSYEKNPEFYSKIGFKLLPAYQSLGTKINYLTYLPYKDHMFKIGIVSSKDLIDDLIYWNTFYLAGRFQKPIEIIKSNSSLEHAINLNRLNALKVALLASNKQIITQKTLFQLLCSLSFIGDWRHIFPIENPNKIHNIVNGSLQELNNIYTPLNHNYYIKDSQDKIIINYKQVFNELNTLPINLQIKIQKSISSNNDISVEDLKKLRITILNYFKKMNMITSAFQPAKGLALNGFAKTKTYLIQKIEKR